MEKGPLFEGRNAMFIMTDRGWQAIQEVKGHYCPFTQTNVPTVKMQKDKSLIEILGLDPRDLSEQYINAIDAFIAEEISWEKCLGIIGSKRLLPNGGL
jgi:hypothetical protein